MSILTVVYVLGAVAGFSSLAATVALMHAGNLRARLDELADLAKRVNLSSESTLALAKAIHETNRDLIAKIKAEPEPEITNVPPAPFPMPFLGKLPEGMKPLVANILKSFMESDGQCVCGTCPVDRKPTAPPKKK